MKSKAGYDAYTVEDFVMDRSFQQYCLGNNDAAERFWNEWLLAHPHKVNEVEKAREIYSLLNGGNKSREFKTNRSLFRERLQKQGITMESEAAPVIQLPVQKQAARQIPLFRLAGVAVVLLLLCIGAFFLPGQKQPQNTAKAEAGKKLEKLPGGDKAILTLADGRQIVLDTASNGSLAEQGGSKVIKLGGQLRYDAESKPSEVVYNTITTPKGGQYQLELADGSKVWLNAGSSLRFPAAFTADKRTVALTGEGYFEVSHDPARPFHVTVGDMDVKVLGTHFNINSYRDEPAMATTLLHGKVRVTKGNEYLDLNPGQQAIVGGSNDKIRVEYKADVDEAVAWKNGLIYFDGADVGAVMRQISRWYDVDVEYSGNIKAAHLSGKVSRDLNLSQVVKVLEELGIDVRTEGAKLIATPKS